MGKRTACLRQLGGDRANTERFRRFLHNPSVTREIMLSTAADHTARGRHERHVLAIQDTTELNFSGHAGSKRGFGVVGNGRDIGLFLHPVIVVDAGSGDPLQVGHAGGILGLADAFISSRKKAPPGAASKEKPERRKARPIETQGDRALDRRSARGGPAAWRRGDGDVIADCESDIYEEFATPRSAHVHLLVRAAYNRRLTNGGKLFAAMAVMPAFAGAGDRHSRQAGPARARGANPRELWRNRSCAIAWGL